MAYYDPYYPSTTLPLRLQSPTQHLVQAQIAARLHGEDILAREHLTRSLLVNERAELDLYRTYYNHERDKISVQNAQAAIQFNYLRKIQQLRRERQLLDNSDILAKYPLLDVNQRSIDQRHMSDEELLRLYQSGSREKEYRQELLAQLRRNDHNHSQEPRSGQQGSHLYQKQSERSPHQVRHEGKQERQRSQDDAVKRSYIDELNNTSDSAFRRSRQDFNKGQTIDVFARTNDSPFKAYMPKTKRKGKNGIKSVNKMINNSIAKGQKQQYSHTQRREQPAQAVTSSAMKKINNRLKVAEVIYKDSKLRHQKHEIDHLINTYLIEVKQRKEVKNKINNHPSILKKHHMVVDSR